MSRTFLPPGAKPPEKDPWFPAGPSPNRPPGTRPGRRPKPPPIVPSAYPVPPEYDAAG